jgi:hypothetical protein
MRNENNGLGKTVAIGLGVIMAIVVLVFLGLHSLNFFTFTFVGGQEIYAWLGFGLTSGGLLAYVAKYKFYSPSRLSQFVDLGMIIVCLFGELATAGFGMRLDSMKEAGLSLTKQDIDMMILAVQALGFVHAIALIIEVVGDQIGDDFKVHPMLANDTVFEPASKKYEQSIPAPVLKKDESISADAPFSG